MNNETLAAFENVIRKTFLFINTMSADSIGLSYDTMPGNSPEEYKNFVALWQNQIQIPWNLAPLNRWPIPSNSQSGSMMADNLALTVNSYILGYAVGPEIGNICSTAFIPAGTFDPGKVILFQTSVSIVYISSTGVVVHYETPPGYEPGKNKNWIGIWIGSIVPYGEPPMKKVEVSGNTSVGDLAIDGIMLKRGTTYSVGYFTGPDQTNLAASVTFTV